MTVCVLLALCVCVFVCVALLKKVLRHAPSKRYTMDQIKSHVWSRKWVLSLSTHYSTCICIHTKICSWVTCRENTTGFLCHGTEFGGLLCIVLCCIVDLYVCILLSCLGTVAQWVARVRLYTSYMYTEFSVATWHVQHITREWSKTHCLSWLCHRTYAVVDQVAEEGVSPTSSRHGRHSSRLVIDSSPRYADRDNRSHYII